MDGGIVPMLLEDVPPPLYDSDDEDFVSDEDVYIDERECLFDTCLLHLQEYMPDSMEEIEESVQTAKRQKIEIDELQEKIKELEEAQTEKEVRAFGKEAEEREIIRAHEKEMVASQIALAESRLKTATLEAEHAKMAGGGSTGGRALPLTLLRVTAETEFLVKGHSNWVEIVRLM